MNLLLAQEVAASLSARGVRVVLTRSTDATVPLSIRTALANNRGADLFVSLHNNAGARGANWTEVYRQVVERAGSAAAARDITAGLNRAFGGGRSVRLLARSGRDRDYYFVLRNTTMPAALVEGAFVSTPAEAAALANSPGFRATLARGVADGILDYQRGLAPPVPPHPDAGDALEVAALPLPRSLTAVGASAWQVALTWGADPTVPQYRVVRNGAVIAVLDNPSFAGRATPAGAVPPNGAVVNAATMAWVDRWTGPGQQYRYEVRAVVASALPAGPATVVESRPATAEASTPGILVVLDPGHGGADPGAVGRT